MPEQQKLTFFERKASECPICEAKFYREDLISGGGRLLAGTLTDELRRLYEPSKKFGEVYPLIYTVTVCPVCYYAAYPQDFANLPLERSKEVEVNADNRRDNISLIFSDLDFTSPRTLKEGVASYFFAIMCYEFFEKESNPTFKSGLSALRAAWLLMDLHAQASSENYDQLANLFYRKARFFFKLTLDRELNRQEPLAGGLQFGPDLDKNYGYDGLIYLTSYLDYRYGSQDEVAARVESLESDKRMIAKVFGMGKASKARPSALLDQAKKIYADMGMQIAKLKGESPPVEDMVEG
jgi:uncharacterized protein (DUF2225 family)